jgi:hypothetical protein
MPLSLDLNLLESDKKFEQMCFRLAQKEFPKAIPTAHGSRDGGRDAVLFNTDQGDVVWQCKFSHQGLSKLKPKIMQSLKALDPAQKISRWILCVSMDGSGEFHDWLRDRIEKEFRFIATWELWDKEILLQRLEKYPDVLHVFFFPIWKALESRFRTDDLELVRYQLEADCGWVGHPTALYFFQKGSSSDLVLDVIVRSRGTLQSLLQAVRVEIADVRRHLRGLPGTALLYSQHTYSISLRGGKRGTWCEALDPPLTVNYGENQRFKIKLTEAGYAWTGYVKLTLIYGDQQELGLPTILLRA